MTAVTLTLTSLTSNHRVVANFSDKKLPKFARLGEIYVTGGVLYVYADLDNNGGGRWYPLTNSKVVYTFDQKEPIDIWSINYDFPTPPTANLQVVVYDDNDEVIPFVYDVNIVEKQIILDFKKPTSGRAYIVDSKSDEWKILKTLNIGDNSFVVSQDDNGKNVITIDTKNFSLREDGKSTFFGGMTINDDISASQNMSVGGNQIINGNLDVHGVVNIHAGMNIYGPETSLHTQKLTVSDNVITINSGQEGSADRNAGLEIDRGYDGILPLITFDELNDKVVIPVRHNLTFIQDEVAGKTFVGAKVSEITNRIDNVEFELKNSLTLEKNRIDSILLASQANLDSFTEVVTLINSVDVENDNVFAGFANTINKNIDDIVSGVTAVGSSIKLSEAKTISLVGGVSGSVVFDGSTDVAIHTTIETGTHTHSVSEVSDLQTILSNKQPRDTNLDNFGSINDFIDGINGQ